MTETPPEIPPVQPDAPEAEVPPPAKKAAKKAPAKKAAAPPPADDEKPKPNGSLYLPALPEGFAYTGVTATGPRGETINITPTDGGAQVRIEGNDLDRTSEHPDMKHALGAASRKAKAMSDLAKREAELAALRAEAFDS